MKKIVAILALAAMPFITLAQTTAFDKFQDVEGIETVIVNKEMFKMMGDVEISGEGDKAQKFMDMVEKIDGLRVFTTKVKKHKKEMRKTVNSYLKQNPLKELLSVNSDGSKVKIYVKQDKDDLIKEGLVFVEDDDEEMVLVSFTGNINLKDLDGLKNL